MEKRHLKVPRWAKAIWKALEIVARTKMTQTSRAKKPVWLYLIVAWMVLNVILLALMIPGDQADLNNYIEVVFWTASIGSLATMRKAGAAFAVCILCITLGTSMFNVLIGYYTSTMGELFVYVNAARIIVNAALSAFMFKALFDGKFK